MPIGPHVAPDGPGWSRRLCPACGATLSDHERHAGGWCASVACRHRRLTAQRRADFLASLVRERDDASTTPAEAVAPVVLVRRHRTDLVPLAAPRREAMRAHLATIVAEAGREAGSGVPGDAAVAFDGEAGRAMPIGPDTLAPAGTTTGAMPAGVPAAVAPADPPLLGSICARCGGYCCRTGGQRHAFIDLELLQRVQALEADRSLDAVAAAYLAALPAAHVIDSCSFHGERGCALPRDWRSDICNQFECAGLEQARVHAAAGTTVVYLVRRDDELGIDAGFVQSVAPTPAHDDAGDHGSPS